MSRPFDEAFIERSTRSRSFDEDFIERSRQSRSFDEAFIERTKRAGLFDAGDIEEGSLGAKKPKVRPLFAPFSVSIDEQAPRKVFDLVFREYDLPRAILSDNGSPFGSPGWQAFPSLDVVDLTRHQLFSDH